MHPALPALGQAAFQAGFLRSLPPPSRPGAGYLDAMATASLQPASPISGLLPFRSGSVIHVSNEEFLPSAPPFGQSEATGRLHSDNFPEFDGKGPFC